MQPVAPLVEVIMRSTLVTHAHSALPDAPQLPPGQPSRVGSSVAGIARRVQGVARAVTRHRDRRAVVPCPG